MIVSFSRIIIMHELAAAVGTMAGLQQEAPCVDIIRWLVQIVAFGTAEIQLPLPAQPSQYHHLPEQGDRKEQNARDSPEQPPVLKDFQQEQERKLDSLGFSLRKEDE